MQDQKKAELILWNSYTKGNQKAFADLYKMFAKSLIQYGNKITSDPNAVRDSVHDLFLDLWNTRQKKKHVQNVNAYLIKSLRYKLIKSQKSGGTLEVSEDLAYFNSSNAELNMITKELEKEHSYTLRTLINNLPARQNELIHLRYYQNLTVSEIAEVLNIKKQSVSNLINRALISLKSKAKNKIASK